MRLSEMKPGARGTVCGYAKDDASYLAKLLALGLTRGTAVEIVGVAPLGDPFEIAVRGYRLTLRRNEAKIVQIAQAEGGK